MTYPNVRQRLIARSVSGRYDLFLGVGAGLAILGLILVVRSLAAGAADRTWQLIHVNWLYFSGLAGGSVAFAAVQKITKAKWSGLVIRFAEASAAFMPIAYLAFLAIFTAGYQHIYKADLHQLPHSKALWLSHAWMFARLGIGLAVLYIIAWKLIRADMVPDLFVAKRAVSDSRRGLFERWTSHYDGSEGSFEVNEHRIHRLAPLYVVVYAIVLTLVAFDAIMALQPHWYSNLLGGFYFMGSFLGAHMLLALMTIYGGRHLGIADLISPKQRHDLGKLCFGFTVFWTYLMWAQFLVIWYGNLPEETGFVFARLWGHWLPVGTAVFLGMFVIPFFGLLGVPPKKIRAVLGFFALVSLIALWLERYLLVLPSVTALPGPVFGIPELGPTLLFLGLFLLCYAVFGRTFPMVSPRLAEITLDRERGHNAATTFDHEEAASDYVQESALERRHHPRNG